MTLDVAQPSVVDHILQQVFPDLVVSGERALWHPDTNNVSVLTTLGVVTFPGAELDACGDDAGKLVACVEKHVDAAIAEAGRRAGT